MSRHGCLLRLARWPLVGLLLGWVLTHASFAIPVKRLRETETLIAFYHPHPSYPVHILLLPKQAWRDLMALETADAAFLSDLVQTTQSLVAELGLEGRGYRLICNGGRYQDVAQLHFHLVAGEAS